MPLDHDTARGAVQQWRLDVEPDWTDQDADLITDALVALSADLTPLVTGAAALDEDQEQRYLLTRAIDELNDWLTRAAAGVRTTMGLDAPAPAPGGSPSALGLRTATLAELEALPAIGSKGALAIARMSRLHPDLTDVYGLEHLEAVGPRTLEGLRQHTYLDQPVVSLVSRALIAFASSPSVPTYLRVLAGTDLEVVVADGATLHRRPPVGGTQTERLVRLVTTVAENASITRSPASGAIGSEAAQLLARRRLRDDYLARLTPASGEILTNHTYVAAAAKRINEAQERIRLMVFLGTATAGDDLHPGPLELVEALEARAAAGVDVRVLLDQDDGGEPFRSVFINQPLVDRLRGNSVAVRFDSEDVLLHSKVLVIDGGSIIVGSHNWTRTGFNDAHELSVLIESSAIAGEYETHFAAQWEAAGP